MSLDEVEYFRGLGFSWTIDNIDYVTGIGNCIKPEGTMRVVFSTSYLLPVNVRPYIQM